LVARTVHLPALDPGAGECSGPAADVVVAAGAVVDARRATDLTGPHDERVVEHPALLQVGQEAGPGVFHGRCEPAVPLEVVRVRVVATLPNLDECDSALDELAGEQAALAEFAIAVKILVLGPLRVDLERLAALLQPAGGLV